MSLHQPALTLPDNCDFQQLSYIAWAIKEIYVRNLQLLYALNCRFRCIAILKILYFVFLFIILIHILFVFASILIQIRLLCLNIISRLKSSGRVLIIFKKMETKGKEISLSERKIIIKLWKDGESFRKIGQTIERTYSSVQGVINN